MRPVHKAAVGGTLTAGVVALSVAMFNHWEGISYRAEHLPFDPPGVITVCGGITNADWPWLKVGMTFTATQCREAIATLIPRYAAPLQKCVDNFTTLPPHRQAALIDFSVNLGPGRVCNSSIAADLNAGRVKQACDAMLQYIKANGKVLKGLVNRRRDPIWGERSWCMRED